MATNKRNKKQDAADPISLGFNSITRDVMQDPAFLKKPFDECHALFWLLFTARYTNTQTTQYVGKSLVTWGRGEIPASVRYLAEAFGWGKHKVENWLNRLEEDGTIKRRQTQGQTVLQVIKYLTVQKPGRQKGQLPGQKEGQQNPLPLSDTTYMPDTKGDAKGDTNGEIWGTIKKNPGDKTVNKDLNTIENKESVCVNENAKSHTQDFFEIMNKEKYGEFEKEQIKIVHGYICRYAPVLLKFKKPLTPKDCLAFAKKYTAEISIHIFKAIEDKVGIEKRRKSAAETINIFLKNETDPKIKASIKRCQLSFEKNKSNSPLPKNIPKTAEEKGKLLIDEVINAPYVRPAMETETKEIEGIGTVLRRRIYANSG